MEAPSLSEDLSTPNPAPPAMIVPVVEQLSLEENDDFPPGEEPQELIDRLRLSSMDSISLDEGQNREKTIDEEVSVPTQSFKLPKVFKCQNCNQAFSRHKWAMNHCRKEASWTCDKCGDVIKHRNNVGRHRIRCLKQTEKPNPSSSEKVVRIEIGDTKCSLCGQSFKNNASLRAHVSRKHREDKVGNLDCDKCEFKTMTQSQLKKHNTLVHKTNIASNCQECDFSCFSKGGLRKHVRNVHETSPEKPELTSTDDSDSVVLSEDGLDEVEINEAGDEPVLDVRNLSTKVPSVVEQIVVTEGMGEESNKVLFDMDTLETIELNNESYAYNFTQQSNDISVSMVENVLNFNAF